jgi:uncharacterized membrane protein
MATDTALRGSQEHSTNRNVSSKGQACGLKNVGMDERHVTLVLGGALAALGLFRMRPMSLLLGGGLIYRGMTGHCAAYEALGINTNEDK